MESLTGKLLIAVPDLPDSNFYRSVILVMNHTEDGAMGVILNRPSNITVDQVWDKVSPQIDCDCDDPTYAGGAGRWTADGAAHKHGTFGKRCYAGGLPDVVPREP